MAADEGTALRFRLLGQVAGWRGTVEMAFGSAHRRTVLAILALSADRVVSREELIDALWGDRPPTSAMGSIYTYVSGLRRALGDRNGDRQLLESVGSGYTLRVPKCSVDVHRFEVLRADAQKAVDSGDLLRARTALDGALGLWQGGPLAGLTGPFAEAQRTRLGEFRLATLEQRAEISLATGGHADVAADLVSLTREYPLRETLRGLLMRALHGCGRTTEALAVFTDLRETLIQTSGTEPSPALSKLHEQILRSGPVSRPVDTGSFTVSVPVPTDRTARRGPVRAPVLVGRETLLNDLRAAVDRVMAGRGDAVLIQGEAGIGKSALLAEVFATTATRGGRIGWAVADKLVQNAPLDLITRCLDAVGHPAGSRLATAVADGGADLVGEIVPTVREMCADGPLVLIADDLQWADEASVLAWRRLIRLTEDLPLLLVAARRQLPRRADLEQVRLDMAVRGAQVVTPEPLSDAAVQALVAHIAGASPSRELRQVAARGAGNPFYVNEFIGKLVADGDVVVDGSEAYPVGSAGSTLPPAVALLISDHLGQLSVHARDAMRWAALFEHDFTIADLAAAVERPVANLVDAVDEALRAGLLVDNGEWLSFRHPVVRLTLYDSIPTSMRVVLHRQLAETLAKSGAAVCRVAEQLAAARAPVDAWASAWLADHIGTIAMETPHVAVTLLRHAVAQTALPAAEREALTATLARLLFFLGQEPSTVARLVLARTLDSQCAAEMRWILAYMHLRHGNPVEAAEEVRRTLADSEVSEAWRGRHLRLRDTVGRGEQNLPILSVMDLLDVDLFADDMAASIPVARRIAASHAIPGEVHLAGAVHSYWVGRWQEVAHEVRTILYDCPETSSYLLRTPGAVLLVNGLAATIAGHRGEMEHARGYLRSASQQAFPQSVDGDFDPDAAGFLMAATAMLAEQEGRPEQALDALTPILDPYYPCSVRYQWLAHLARLAVAAGDHERAMHAMHAVQVSDVGAIGEAHAVVAHCQGIVTGNPDQILAAAAYYRTTDLVLQLGRALEDAAVLLAEHRRLSEARVAIRGALTGYTRTGAGWDVRRAETRMRPFGIRRANIAD